MVLPWWFEPVALTSLVTFIFSAIVTAITSVQWEDSIFYKVTLVPTFISAAFTILCGLIHVYNSIWIQYL